MRDERRNASESTKYKKSHPPYAMVTVPLEPTITACVRLTNAKVIEHSASSANVALLRPVERLLAGSWITCAMALVPSLANVTRRPTRFASEVAVNVTAVPLEITTVDGQLLGTAPVAVTVMLLQGTCPSTGYPSRAASNGVEVSRVAKLAASVEYGLVMEGDRGGAGRVFARCMKKEGCLAK